MSSPDEQQDGRAARARRTRDAVIDAVQALINDGDPDPSARRIAERAGVSTRSIFAHFSSLEDLHRAVAEQAAVRVIDLLWPIDPGLPLAQRIEELCTQRAKVHEEIGPLRRAAARREPSSPALAEMQAHARRASRDQISRVFAAELDRLDGRARRRRLAVADAMVSGEAWDLLRGTHGLSASDARRALEDAVGELLAAATAATAATPATAEQSGPAPQPNPGPGTPGQPEPAERRTRLRAARRALTEADEKIDRLIAAIEDGSPADLLAPRLRELRTARLAAQRELDAADPSGPEPAAGGH